MKKNGLINKSFIMSNCIEAVRSPEFSTLTHIDYGFLTSNGGISSGIYKSLNCGLGSDDLRDNVLHNRRLAEEFFSNKRDKKLFSLSQVHSNKVFVLRKSSEHLDKRPEADAAVTDDPSVILSVLTADCVPVLFADKKKNIIGAAHSGWKGTISGVIENTLESMVDLGSVLKDIYVVIGVAIQQTSYEVGKDILEKFVSQDPANRNFFIDSKNKDHYMFDLKGVVSYRLKKAGIVNLENVDIDSYSNETKFFSYRRSCHKNQKDYGRNISCITLK